MASAEKNDKHNGSIRKREDGRYEGRICINNQRKSVYGKTEAEVKRKIREYRNKIATGFIEPKKITLNEYIEYWLLTYKYNIVEDSSYDKLERVYIHQIKDSIGKKKIGTITSKDIQSLINQYAYSEENNLAYSGLQRIMHLLNPCFRMAKKEGVVQENPCELVLLPRRDKLVKETKEQFTLSDAELKLFKEAALVYNKNNVLKYRDGIILMIMVNTGLRVGEMLALTWSDVDLVNKVIRVNKTMQSNLINRTGNGNKIIAKVKKGTKTVNGTRVIPLNDNIIEYFNMLIKDNLMRNITSEYVCSTRANTRQTARNLQRSLTRIQDNTNISRHITLHTLRHTFGSTLIRNGVDVSIVSKIMGHANITITYNKYIHVIQEQAAKAMQMNKVV